MGGVGGGATGRRSSVETLVEARRFLLLKLSNGLGSYSKKNIYIECPIIETLSLFQVGVPSMVQFGFWKRGKLIFLKTHRLWGNLGARA